VREISVSLKMKSTRSPPCSKNSPQLLQRDKILLADSLADISHQLKTPLTSLYVLNDLLSEDPSEQNREKYLNRMRSQLKRVEWLVTSLLKLSKLDAGTVTMKREEVYVHTLVEKALESLSIPLDIKMPLPYILDRFSTLNISMKPCSFSFAV
jgi:signal transduction histidine kinase